MLVESNFTDEEIENEVQTFMFAVSNNLNNCYNTCTLTSIKKRVKYLELS